MRIYFISGLGVDERLFMNLRLPGYEVHHVKWILPHKNESLKDYALRLAEQIDTSRPFVLSGVSFGGMCATEIAKVVKPEKVILISSCKGDDELPWTIKWWRYFPLHKVLSDKFYINSAVRTKEVFGFKGKEQGELLRSMLETMPAGYFARACNCIINWRNREHVPTIHIHGDGDLVLPFKKRMNAKLIKGGSHVMVFANAEEVNRLMLEALNN